MRNRCNGVPVQSPFRSQMFTLSRWCPPKFEWTVANAGPVAGEEQIGRVRRDPPKFKDLRLSVRCTTIQKHSARPWAMSFQRAYSRSAALEKRRKLMDAWANFYAETPAA